MVKKIYISLWFDKDAREAAEYYISIFRKSKIKEITYYDEPSSRASGQPYGSVMTVLFELEGLRFLALNGGPMFKFTPAISIVLNCDTQEEIDYYWEKLSRGGSKDMCGWLTDKYGISWQIVTPKLDRMLQSKNKKKSSRAMEAMLKMRKIDIKKLQEAFNGN